MAEAATAEEYACPHCAGDPSNASAAAAAAAAAAAFVEPGSYAGLPIEVLGDQEQGATMAVRLASDRLQASDIAGLRRDSMTQSSGADDGEMQRRIAAREMQRVVLQQQQIAEMQAEPMAWGLRQHAAASGGARAMGAMPVAGARPLDGLPPVDQQQPHGGTGHAVTSDTGHFRAYHILRRFAAAALCRISTEDERHHARTALVRARECYDSVIIGHRARGLRLPGPEADAWEAEAREAGHGLSLMEQQAEEVGLAPAPLGWIEGGMLFAELRRTLPEVGSKVTC
jgi:hypothetical protein